MGFAFWFAVVVVVVVVCLVGGGEGDEERTSGVGREAHGDECAECGARSGVLIGDSEAGDEVFGEEADVGESTEAAKDEWNGVGEGKAGDNDEEAEEDEEEEEREDDEEGKEVEMLPPFDGERRGELTPRRRRRTSIWVGLHVE